jgi:hypothetical protein
LRRWRAACQFRAHDRELSSRSGPPGTAHATLKIAMHRFFEISSGVLAVLVAVALTEWHPMGFLTLPGTWVLCVAFAFAPASLPTKIATTGLAIYCSYLGAILGRTMNVGLRIDTLVPAVLCGLLFSFIPIGCMQRIWRVPRAWLLALAILPIGLSAALAVASLEEYLFVRNHPHGAPATSRWTVSMHHFGYIAEEKRLWGND